MHPQSNPFLTRRTLLQAAGALAGSAATSHGLALSQAHGAHAAQKSVHAFARARQLRYASDGIAATP